MNTLQALENAFLAHHQAVGNAPATIRHYADSLSLLKRCLTEEDLPLTTDSLTSHTMNIFAGWLRRTPTKPWRGNTERSIFGIQGALKDIRAFLRWCHDDDLLEIVPKVPVPKLPHILFDVLSEEELKTVFDSSYLWGNSEQGLRNRALIAFMLDTGVRLSEVGNLQLAELSIKDGEAKITGKGNKERMVYFSDAVTALLQKWLTIRGDDAGSVLWLAPSGITMLFHRIQRETKLPVFTPHQIRHTAFTMMVKRGVDLHTIKRIAGHASVTTTEAYLALAGADMKEKHNLGSPFEAIQQQMPERRRGRRRLRSA
jgi:integrase/recombinase XerC